MPRTKKFVPSPETFLQECSATAKSLGGYALSANLGHGSSSAFIFISSPKHDYLIFMFNENFQENSPAFSSASLLLKSAKNIFTDFVHAFLQFKPGSCSFKVLSSSPQFPRTVNDCALFMHIFADFSGYDNENLEAVTAAVKKIHKLMLQWKEESGYAD